MDAWVGVVGVLAGVAVGALAEGLRSKAAFWRERRWEAHREGTRRVEELFTAIEEIHLLVSVSAVEAMVALTAGQAAKGSNGPVVPCSKVAMIVGLYLPALASHRDSLFTARDEIGKVLVSCVVHRNATRDVKDNVLLQLRRASRDFDAACDAFRSALAEVARSHDRMLKAGAL